MRVLSLLILVSVLGCGSGDGHITFPPLPPQLTPAQRLDVWQHWHSRASAIEEVTTCSNKTGCSTRTHEVVVLEGGVEVRHAEDVLPLVHPGSETAAAARTVAQKRERRGTYKWIALGTVAVTLGLLGLAIHEDSPMIAFSGLGAFGLGEGIGLGGIYSLNNEIDAANNRGLKRYDQGLVQRLELCVKGTSLVPCEIETPGTLSVPIEDPEQDPVLRSLPQR